MGRKTRLTYPPDSGGASRSESSAYDGAGNLQTYSNRAGAVQTFSYDGRNRQTGFSWSDGTTQPQTMAYDPASRVTQIGNWDATIKNVYFNDNLLKSQEEWTGDYGDNVHRTVTYAYDADGNRGNIIYPSGKNYSYGYYGRNDLWYVLDNLTGIYQAAYIYDVNGNVTTRYVGNSWVVTDAAQRDPLNRVKHLEHRLVGTTRTFNYLYDAVGNRTSAQRDGGAADTYGYDLADQLTRTTLNGATTTLGYDANGNRTSQNGGGAYGSNSLNQFTTFNGGGASYDANGNLASYNGWTYLYDAQNRLKTVKQGSTAVEQFWYDGLNRQITRNLNGAITFNVWDGWNLIEERGLGNALQNAYLNGAGGGIVENLTTQRFFIRTRLAARLT